MRLAAGNDSLCQWLSDGFRQKRVMEDWSASVTVQAFGRRIQTRDGYRTATDRERVKNSTVVKPS
jgi:hypothetical protein